MNQLLALALSEDDDQRQQARELITSLGGNGELVELYSIAQRFEGFWAAEGVWEKRGVEGYHAHVMARIDVRWEEQHAERLRLETLLCAEIERVTP